MEGAMVARVPLGVALGALGAVAFVVGFRVGPGTATEAPLPSPAAASSSTSPLFLQDCAPCHGADARGTELAPDLRGAGAALVDYELSTGRMPLPISDPHRTPERSKPRYSAATRRALVEYVTALAGGGGPAIPDVDVARGDLAHGGSLYRLNCAACHSWAGTGGALVDRSAPSIRNATDVEIAEAVRSGPGEMPAFGTDAFTQHQLDSLVRYASYLRNPTDQGGVSLWHLGPLVEGAVAVFVGLGLLLLAVRWIGTRT
jgi:ubiquinol-cytochrome c reductase cytochrome c subunit